MPTLLALVLACAFSLSPLLASADEKTPVKFKSTGEGDSTMSTGYSPSDPLQGKPVDKGSDAGHPLTQQPYDETCTEDRCIRAEKRQTGTTTWQEDRASGLHVTPKKSDAPPESSPSK